MLNRFPKITDIIPVFAFTAFLVYGRMLYTFVWKLPSWLKFLTVGEILSNLSYALMHSMLETLGIVLFLLAVSFVLPSAWFRDVFVPRGVWTLSVWFVSWAIYFSRLSKVGSDFIAYLYLWTAITVVIALFAAFVAARTRWMRSAALWFADRAVIFLFIFIPASFVGALVVAVRNIV